MTVLLDSNLLIALIARNHVHNGVAVTWLIALDGQFATCPITQGSLLRFSVRSGRSMAEASESLGLITADSRHDFWADDIGYGEVRMTGVIGHRQMTDAYLAQLARHRQGRVATFDKGFAALHGDVAELLAVGS